MEKTVASLEELNAEAGDFVLRLTPRDDSATLVALSGELGAGKTAFVKAAAKALGVSDMVNSPTFVLEKIYMLPAAPAAGAAFKRLVHIDAYRLDSGAELAALGFDEVMKDGGNLVMLEWPEKVAGALPAPAARITLTALADGGRKLAYA